MINHNSCYVAYKKYKLNTNLIFSIYKLTVGPSGHFHISYRPTILPETKIRPLWEKRKQNIYEDMYSLKSQKQICSLNISNMYMKNIAKYMKNTWVWVVFTNKFLYSEKWYLNYIWATTWQNQQNSKCPQQRLRSTWASAQSDQSSLSAWRKLWSLATHWAHGKDSDQTGWMPRLI